MGGVFIFFICSDCPLLVLSLKRKIFVQRYINGEVTELTNITFFYLSAE